ncbi:Stf0 family sulfotransferase [Qingshengfaniella alkalisoli]|uniref:Sulphotransferase Stf0 domain-containing protein n=1 Tax=Qingshengfaniella alkalisoli TaxID=2599296 RepID=A0A5B8J4I7_9RHOB|nr:Stf0 family sulfotransferase [Qingshengfaniella alkalisoli]QDY71618.1 hypothetical protein FPZ52_18290 [Qingshengfaniella alkalisoli]
MSEAARSKKETSAVDVSEELWDRQFDTGNDFPPATLRYRIAICTTPRCGSHFLGHQMRATGAFGYPLEYLNPGNWTVWESRAQQVQATDTLAYIKSVRTGPNGVFATKLHYEHLERFLQHEPDPLSYHFIHLRRRDLTRQAISFARAQQTGAWISDMPERAEGYYDYDLITEKLNRIAEDNARWTAFYSGLRMPVLELWYEDVVSDPRAAMNAIAAHVGVAMPEHETTEMVFQPKVQRSAGGETDDWRQRFEADCQAALRRRAALPGYRPIPRKQIVKARLRHAAKRLQRRVSRLVEV